jgi:hypothetical protein
MRYNLESTLPINAFSPRGGRSPFALGMTLEGGGGGFVADFVDNTVGSVVDAGEAVGGAVVDVGEAVGGAVVDVGSFINDAVIQPAIDDPVGTAVKIAAIAAAPATGGASLYAIPAYTATKAIAAGVPLEDVAVMAAIQTAATYAGVSVADYVGTLAEFGTEIGSQQTAMLAAQNAGIGTGAAASTTAGQIAGGAASGAIASGAAGGDIGQGLLSGAVNAGISAGVNAGVDTGAGLFNGTTGSTNTGTTGMDEIYGPTYNELGYSPSVGPTYSELGYDPYANLNAGDVEAQQGGFYGGPEYGYQPANPYANMSDAELTAALASQNGTSQSTALNLVKQFGSQAVKSLLGGGGTAAQRAALGLGQNTGLGNLFGGAAGVALTAQQRNAIQNAYNTQSQRVGNAATQAQNLASFTPIGTTNFFGSSQFTRDPVTGQITSAGYTPTAQVAGQMQNLFGLGAQALPTTTDPLALQQQYITQQQGLLAPGRERQLAQLQNRQYQTGTTGLATGGTMAGYAPNAQGLMATNPAMAAYYNAIAQEDARLAANAPTYAQSLLDKQIATGTGLFGAANTLQGYAQQPFTMSTDLAKAQAAAGASAGQLGLTGQTNAAQLAATGALQGNAAMQGTYNQLGQVATGLGNQVGGMLLQNPTIANWLS